MIYGVYGWELIGLGLWIIVVLEYVFEVGYYGQVVYNVCILCYVDWIDIMICIVLQS